jgi:hypothetical protein
MVKFVCRLLHHPSSSGSENTKFAVNGKTTREDNARLEGTRRFKIDIRLFSFSPPIRTMIVDLYY